MYLTVTLLSNEAICGFTVSCPKPLPDILLTFSDQRVWVEAIAPTAGQMGRPATLTEAESGVSREVQKGRSSFD